MVNKSNEILLSRSYERRGETRRSSFLQLALANIALASTMFGAIYLIGRADKTNAVSVEMAENTQVESGLAEDSLAKRHYNFLVNAAHAMTRGTKIEITNGDYVAVHTDEEYQDNGEKKEKLVEAEDKAEKEQASDPKNENTPKAVVDKPEVLVQEVPKNKEQLSEAEAKAYIYRRESGNRLDAINPYGCIGLGQDCNSRLHIQCPDWQTNRKCQDGFWEDYMKRRYGTWNKAKSHWDARVPINGVDRGHWW